MNKNANKRNDRHTVKKGIFVMPPLVKPGEEKPEDRNEQNQKDDKHG